MISLRYYRCLKDWASEEPKNEAVIPFISMHGSTRAMVEHLVAGLSKRGISVMQFDLSVTDIGKVAISLVDAATIVIGTPTVHVGPHPVVSYAAHLVNALRPKLKFASVIGSYGWSSKAIEHIAALIPNLKVEIIPPVLCKGLPRENDYKSLDTLADAISQRHKYYFHDRLHFIQHVPFEGIGYMKRLPLTTVLRFRYARV